MKKLTILIILVVIIFLLFANYIDTENITTYQETGISVKIEDALSYLPQKQFETIINPDNPKTEEIVFETEPSVYKYNENTNLRGREVIKYTYNTTQDGLLGPITFYVDKETGIVLASDYRE